MAGSASSKGKAGLDTSYLVALLCGWHEFHERTRMDFEARRRAGARLVVPVHALLECFSVLTRLPAPYRLTPALARELMSHNFRGSVEVPFLSNEDCWELLAGLSTRGIGGGKIWDAVIAHSCRTAGATILLTWDASDFRVVAPPDLHVAKPEGVNSTT